MVTAASAVMAMMLHAGRTASRRRGVVGVLHRRGEDRAGEKRDDERGCESEFLHVGFRVSLSLFSQPIPNFISEKGRVQIT